MLAILMNPWVIGVGTAVLAGLILCYIFGIGRKTSVDTGKGGNGGNASAVGFKSTAIGGKGGRGGPSASGGNGGNAYSTGDNSFSMGGEGGEAGQKNRGGKGGRGPLHVLREDFPEKFREIAETFGVTKEMANKIGKGGDGANKQK